MSRHYCHNLQPKKGLRGYNLQVAIDGSKGFVGKYNLKINKIAKQKLRQNTSSLVLSKQEKKNVCSQCKRKEKSQLETKK